MCFFKKKKKADAAAKTAAASVSSIQEPENALPYDDLTGVLSINRFYEDAAECIRTYVGHPIAICCTSVGNLNAINEKYSRTCGNAVLKETARALSNYDTHLIVARKDEKFAFMTVYEDEKQLNVWLEKLHDALSGVGAAIPEQPKIYMHTGVYCTGGRLVDLTAEEMLKKALLANHEAAKRTHSSFIIYSEQLRIAAEEEEILERDMLGALERRKFAIYIQPRFDIRTSDIIGGKLMSRWHHPDRGVVAAYRYIPLFVKNGFIIKLDIYMLEQTCSLIRGWLDSGLKPMRMSLNVPRLLVTEAAEYVPIYIEMKKKYAIPDGLIELEFSERLLNDSFAASKAVIKQMKDAGFLCAVENFGSGLALDETITDSGVNTVKLSRNFFEEGVISDEDRETIKRAVSVAHAAGLLIAATGVPDELIDELRTLGCDVIQGRLAVMPLSAEEFTALLSQK